MPDLSLMRAVTLVAATSTALLPKNPLRRYALIVNDGITDAYLGLSAPGVVNAGIRINNGGGNYEINSTNLFRGEINAISAGTPAILVVEW